MYSCNSKSLPGSGNMLNVLRSQVNDMQAKMSLVTVCPVLIVSLVTAKMFEFKLQRLPKLEHHLKKLWRQLDMCDVLVLQPTLWQPCTSVIAIILLSSFFLLA